MLGRRLSSCLVLALVTACSLQTDEELATTDTLQTGLPPAELPTYAKGDEYTFDNPVETWKVVSIEDDLVTWQSSLGASQTTMFDPLLPPIQWMKPDKSEGKRRIVEWSGSLFPLKAGNKLTYKSAVRVNEERGHALFVWNCYTGHPRSVSVPAGDFAAFPVYCRRSDGQKLQSLYAPALNSAIITTTIGSDGKEMVRNLVAFKSGSGARVIAKRAESLPGGWSAAAVAKWGRNGVALPRVNPQLVAAAEPPLGLAMPADTSKPKSDKSKPDSKGLKNIALAPPTPSVPAQKEMLTKRSVRAAAAKAKAPDRTYGAHLGSFSSEAKANNAWRIYAGKYDALQDSASHAVYPVDTGTAKGVLYRLVAGPTGARAESKELCTRITEAGGYCRVVALKR